MVHNCDVGFSPWFSSGVHVLVSFLLLQVKVKIGITVNA